MLHERYNYYRPLIILGYDVLFFNTGCLLFINDTIRTFMNGGRGVFKTDEIRHGRGGGVKKSECDVFDR